MASIVLFNLGQSDVERADSPTVSLTVDGLTVTFSNASFGGASRDFSQDEDGLAVLDGPLGWGLDIDRFEIVFDQSVQLISYVPGFLYVDGDESLTLMAGASSSVETGFVEASTAFSNQFTVLAGQTIVATADFGTIFGKPPYGPDAANFDLVQFRELTVDNMPAGVVPEPSSIVAWAGLGFVGLLGYGRRRRKARLSQV
jgi:hypothetical protein